MRNFHQLGQEALTSESVDVYFSSIPRLIADAPEEYTRRFSSYMFPPLCNSEVVERSTATLKNIANLPASVVKSLKIGREQTERCMKAREFSRAKVAGLEKSR
jgi:hypothetical protein